MNKQFIETKEYKRFAEFCDACIKYKYIGICYGPLVYGKRSLPDIIVIVTI
ncbi:hypothetical protein EGLA_32670 [Enterococcus gallinarum]|nr:hypothetical protein AH4_15590 [Enterococcus gallinarum]